MPIKERTVRIFCQKLRLVAIMLRWERKLWMRPGIKFARGSISLVR